MANKKEEYTGLCATCMHLTEVHDSDGSVEYTCPFYTLVPGGETLCCGHYDFFSFVVQ